jgi:electron transfer flavoprotein beta subunit
MNIVVCVKQIIDPEMPTEKFKVKDNQVLPPEGVPPVLNPYDAQAVEAALRVKESHGGTITAITVGPLEFKETVRRALAMGADEGIVLSDEAFLGSDSLATAYILAQAIQKIDEAADWSMGIVGPVIAERLNLPLITLAKNIELLDNNILKVERVIPDGYQVFEISLPAVLTVSNEIGLPRLPTGMGIVSAVRKEIPVWTNQDINADASLIGAKAEKSQLLSLAIPERERECEIVGGETPEEAAGNLAAKLRATGVI